MGQKEWRMPKQPKPFRSRILILGLVSGVALLASIPAVLAKDRQPGIEENYDDREPRRSSRIARSVSSRATVTSGSWTNSQSLVDWE
jgi:hypothetical protein